MTRRLFWLVAILLVRCILGWGSVLRFHTGDSIRVTGYPIAIYQDVSKCIIKIDRFYISTKDICANFPEVRMRVVGNLEKRVIDSFEGNLWLDSAEIEIIEKTQKIKNSKTQNNGYLNNFRESLVDVYKKFVPEPEAGLVSGIVLGYKNDIGQKLYGQMVKSGSIHIAVASGYNILLVGGAILSFSFYFVRRRVAIWLALAYLMQDAGVAGGEPPVVRAVWMAGLMYVGQALGRSYQAGWTLALTIWVMLMISPSLLVSVSFQLSVAACFGLTVVEPRLSKRLTKMLDEKLVDITRNSGVLTTVATMIMTLPIIWWHFGRMNLFGVLSNILILPLVPPLMVSGVGMLILPEIFSWPVYVLSHGIVLVIAFFGI
mgnify:CR=1 FL=1